MADKWVADIQLKEARGETTQLVKMHPRERDRLWGSHDVYRVTNSQFATTSTDTRTTPPYQDLRDSRKEKVKEDKKWRDEQYQQQQQDEAAAAQPPQQQDWWSADQWSQSSGSAWKKQRW